MLELSAARRRVEPIFSASAGADLTFAQGDSRVRRYDDSELVLTELLYWTNPKRWLSSFLTAGGAISTKVDELTYFHVLSGCLLIRYEHWHGTRRSTSCRDGYRSLFVWLRRGRRFAGSCASCCNTSDSRASDGEWFADCCR